MVCYLVDKRDNEIETTNSYHKKQNEYLDQKLHRAIKPSLNHWNTALKGNYDENFSR